MTPLFQELQIFLYVKSDSSDDKNIMFVSDTGRAIIKKLVESSSKRMRY